MARLIFLGRLQTLAGAAERVVEAGPFETVLAALEPDLAAALQDERVRFALNGALLTGPAGIVLGEGDELAFLPPVSGG